MAGQHQVHAAGLEDRQRVLAHLDQLDLGVRVVRALAVGRVVPEGDDPVLGGRREVVAQPGQHRRRVASGSVSNESRQMKWMLP